MVSNKGILEALKNKPMYDTVRESFKYVGKNAIVVINISGNITALWVRI